MEPAIVADMVTKDYVIDSGPRLLVNEIWRKVTNRPLRKFRALDALNFSVERGRSLGVIGVNGAGKSTLLRLVAGVSEPTSGKLSVHGSVASLLEFGAGFESRLSARDNILLNGALLGIPAATLRAKTDEILDFAELSGHADAALRTFSSGMAVRLGFAIAAQLSADILLFDEVLAVGDASFEAKCLQQIQKFRKEGKTILYVSHDLYSVGNACDEVMLLDGGRLAARGEPSAVIQRYWSILTSEEGRASLTNGQVRVDFVGGRMHLWFGAQLLTKAFSGYTSVRSYVRWQESDKGTWKVIDRAEDKFIAECTMWGLPLQQRWTISRQGGGLCWVVELRAVEPLVLERIQTNWMVSDNYTDYDAPTGGGTLPPFLATSDDWFTVYSLMPGQPGVLGLSGQDMPKISVTDSAACPSTSFAIVNSDHNFRGRLIQCRQTDTLHFTPGVWLTFSTTTIEVSQS